ncbi:MAG: hypothetical protein ACREAA_18115 [Candidatus Polarisedimenticolia bacterium]
MMKASHSHPGDDRLFDLAHGLLPRDVGKTCFDHLAACSECEDRFREMTRDRHRALSMEPQTLEPSGASTIRSIPRLWATLGLSAAAIILMAVLFLPGREDGPPPYWLPIEVGNTLLRSGPAPDRYARALEAYERHDAARVVAILESEPIPRQDLFMRLVYASALLLEDRPRQAREELMSIRIDRLPEPSRRRARWLLYSSQRQLAENEEADALLAQLAADPGVIGDLARAEIVRLGSAQP